MRRDLALLLPAHAVGERKKPAVTSRLRVPGRCEVADVILVVRADPAHFGKLCELYLEHWILERTNNTVHPDGSAELLPSVEPRHYNSPKMTGRPFARPVLEEN